MYRVIKTDWYQIIGTRGTIIAETDTEAKATDIVMGLSIKKVLKILEKYNPTIACIGEWTDVTLFDVDGKPVKTIWSGYADTLYDALMKAVDFVAEMEADNEEEQPIEDFKRLIDTITENSYGR